LNSTAKGGLALSNVNLTDLEKIPTGTNLFPGIDADVNDDVNPDFTGALVYNTNTSQLYVSQQNSIDLGAKGIYVWNGNQWNKIGKPEHSIIFAPYNLGADPTYDTPKKQIKYLADCAFNKTDATVWGDLYQWGRIADGHEKRTSPNYPTNDNTVENGALSNSQVDGNGQPSSTSGAGGKFIKTSGTPNNWRNPEQYDLWGNSKLITVGEENKGGVLKSGSYYQNTDWAISANNPCASMGAGWRVPTQDEWERLCNYDSNPSLTGGRVPPTGDILPTGQANTSANSAPLTWVPVKGGKATSDWENTKGNLGGLAVYKTADWEDADTNYKNGTWELYDNGGRTAPEPVLFFPAAGNRNIDGMVTYLGTYGFYWSSTNFGEYGAYAVRLTGITNNTYVDPSANILRGTGLSVRCVKSL
jgi:hypothetical protein